MRRRSRQKILTLTLVAPLVVSVIQSWAMGPRRSSDDIASELYQRIDFNSEERPSYAVFQKALVGYYNLSTNQVVRKPILTIVDFTRPSYLKRLWVIDMEKQILLFHCLTSHGKNSGEVTAHTFSNEHNSHRSSLGFYVTGNTYHGKHGTSLKLRGIEQGINDQAEARAIVIHSASYVSESYVKQNGRLGRSFGCPAIPEEIHKDVIHAIADGSCLFIYHDSSEYASKSSFNKLNLATADIKFK
jgi:hypothetical protein